MHEYTRIKDLELVPSSLLLLSFFPFTIQWKDQHLRRIGPLPPFAEKERRITPPMGGHHDPPPLFSLKIAAVK